MRQSLKSSNKHSLPRQQVAFEAIGTHWQIDYAAVGTQAAAIEAAVRVRIQDFDTTYSRFRSDSWLSSLAGAAGTYMLPADAGPLFALYEAMYKTTSGQVTPLIGQVLSDAGYDASYSLQPKALRQPPKWEDALQLNLQRGEIKLRQPVMLDVGAAGKGYLVDIVSELLEEQGVQEYCVDAGGDMRTRSGNQPLRVGLEDPEHPGRVIGVAVLGNKSLCGSAGNRRRWADLHHIMNPQTLRPAQAVKAVWTVADTTLLADGMSTCLFFTDPKVLRQHFDFSYTIIYADNSFLQSSDFPGELFTTG